MAVSKTILKEIGELPESELEEVSQLIHSIITSRSQNRTRKARRFLAKNLRVGDIVDKNVKCLHPAQVINRSGESITIKWREELELSQEELNILKAHKKTTTKQCIETFSLDKIMIMNAWRNGKKYFDIHEI